MSLLNIISEITSSSIISLIDKGKQKERSQKTTSQEATQPSKVTAKQIESIQAQLSVKSDTKIIEIALLRIGIYDEGLKENILREFEKTLKSDTLTFDENYITSFERFYVVKLYAEALKSLGANISGDDSKIIGEVNDALEDTKKSIEDFKILSNVTPKDVRAILFLEYLRYVDGIKKLISETLPPQDHDQALLEVLKFLSSNEFRVLLFELKEIGTKIERLKVITLKDGKVKREKGERDLLFEIIKKFIIKRHYISDEDSQNPTIILDRMTAFRNEKDIDTKDTDSKGKIFEAGTYLKKNKISMSTLKNACMVIANARERGYEEVIKSLSTKRELAPDEISLDEYTTSLILRNFAKEINMPLDTFDKALAVAFTLLKIGYKNSELRELQRLYGTLGDLTGIPLVIGKGILKSMINEISGREAIQITKAGTSSGGEKIEILKPEELSDISRICATKAVLNKRWKKIPDVNEEIYYPDYIRGIAKIFKRGGLVIQAVFSEDIKESLQKAGKDNNLTDEEKAILKKILLSQQGALNISLEDSECEKLRGELRGKIERLWNKTGKTDYFYILVVIDTLKEKGNLLRIKGGLKPKEVEDLNKFVELLEKGTFGEPFVISLLPRDNLAEKEVYNKGIKILRKIGWQLSEITPLPQEDEGFDIFRDMRAGSKEVTKKQLVKLNGIELHIMITYKALRFGKGEGDKNRLAMLKKLNEEVKEIDSKIEELKEKYPQIQSVKELEIKNKNDYMKYKQLFSRKESLLIKASKISRYMFSDMADMEFLESNEEILKKAGAFVDPIPLLEGYPIVDEEGKAVRFGEGYKTQSGKTVYSAYEFVKTVLEEDGGIWATLSIMPGEHRDTTLAKKTLALMVYYAGMYTRSQIHIPTAILGGIPVAGVISNIFAKGVGGSFLNTDTANVEFGIDSDSDIDSFLPEEWYGRLGFRTRMMLSGIIEPQDSAKVNMAPYIYLLLLQRTTDSLDMLIKILSQESGKGEPDFIKNLGAIDSETVEKAGEYFKRLEENANKLFKEKPELFKKFKEELPPSLRKALIINDAEEAIRFKGVEDAYKLFADKIKGKKVALYLNPDHMGDLKKEAEVFINALKVAFNITGLRESSRDAFISSSDPIVGINVIDGWKESGKSEIIRYVRQQEGTISQLGEMFSYTLENPGEVLSGAFLESVYTGLYFGIMPVVFSYLFTQWAGDVLEAVIVVAKDGDLEKFSEKSSNLLRDAVKLTTQVARFGFDPRVFLYMVKERLDAKDYDGALGVAIAVSRFALYVAYRDYQIAANAFRWMQGRPMLEMRYGLFGQPVRLGTWTAEKAAKLIFEKGFGWTADKRYEFWGKGWEEWKENRSRNRDSIKSNLRYTLLDNRPVNYLKDDFYRFQERYSFLSGPTGYAKRGASFAWDLYWNKITSSQLFTPIYGKIEEKNIEYERGIAFRGYELKEWEKTIGELERSMLNAEETLNELNRKDKKAARNAGKSREVEAFTREGKQAKYEVGKYKGIRLNFKEGDPRNSIFKRNIENVLDAIVRDGINLKIDGKEAKVPVEEVSIVKGKDIGYRIFLYEGCPGIELVIGQELLPNEKSFEEKAILKKTLLNQKGTLNISLKDSKSEKLSGELREKTEGLEGYLNQLIKAAQKMDHKSKVLIEKGMPTNPDVGMIDPKDVRIGDRPLEKISMKIDALQKIMKNLSYEELLGLTEKIESRYNKVKGNISDTDQILDLMDRTTFDLEKVLGKKIGFTDSSTTEVRLAQAREIIRRITDTAAKIGSGAGEIPENIYKEAQKYSKDWGLKRIKGGMNLTTVQIEGILVMHKGYGAQIITGEGKTNVVAALNILNSITGKKLYSTTFNDLTAEQNFRNVEIFLREAGIKATILKFKNSSWATLKRAFAENQLVYIAQSDLTFIHLINRTIPRLKDVIGIDFNNGLFTVDEYDFIVVDEGQTPHLISDPTSGEVKDAKFWRRAWEDVKKLKIKKDYFEAKDGYKPSEDIKFKDIDGKRKVWKELSLEQRHRIRKCLEAKHLTVGTDYEISYWERTAIIIDKSTGQFKYGSEWSDGLHQAIQAKHRSLKITPALETLESITAAEFANLIKWKVGCSGTLLEILPLLERKGIKVVKLETNIPIYEFKPGESVDSQFKKVIEIINKRNEGERVKYGNDIQIVYDPDSTADAEKLIERLIKNKKVNVSYRIDHKEKVFKDTISRLEAVASDMVETVKNEGGGKKARPQVVVVENPALAEALYETVRKSLKSERCRVILLTHKNEKKYHRVISKDLKAGDVIISTLIRRASDIKVAHEKGAVLYVVDRGESSWGWLQKLGRWPRFGMNGERKIYCSLDDQIFHQELDSQRAKELGIDKKKIFKIFNGREKVTYKELLENLLDNKKSSAEFSNIIENAQKVSNEKIFNREFKMEELAKTKANFDFELIKLQEESPVETLRRIIKEEIEILAKRYNIKKGKSIKEWKLVEFENDVARLFKAEKLKFRYIGENAEEFIYSLSEKLLGKFINEEALKKAGVIGNESQKWEHIIFDRFKTAETKTGKTWEKLINKFDSCLGTGNYYINGEGKLIVKEGDISSLEQMREEYISAVKDTMELFRRRVILDFVSKARKRGIKEILHGKTRPVKLEESFIDVSSDYGIKAKQPQAESPQPSMPYEIKLPDGRMVKVFSNNGLHGLKDLDPAAREKLGESMYRVGVKIIVLELPEGEGVKARFGELSGYFEGLAARGVTKDNGYLVISKESGSIRYGLFQLGTWNIESKNGTFILVDIEGKQISDKKGPIKGTAVEVLERGKRHTVNRGTGAGAAYENFLGVREAEVDLVETEPIEPQEKGKPKLRVIKDKGKFKGQVHISEGEVKITLTQTEYTKLIDIAGKYELTPEQAVRGYILSKSNGRYAPEVVRKRVKSGLTPQSINKWLKTKRGKVFARKHADTLRNRIKVGGPSLIVEIIGLLGAIEIAEIVFGIDPQKNPARHFAAVIGVTHVFGTATRPIMSSLLQRGPLNLIKMNFDEQTGNIIIHLKNIASKRMLVDIVKNNFSKQGIVNLRKGIIRFPKNMVGGMGPGLFTAYLADQIAVNTGLVSENSSLRQGVHLGGFFIPHITKIPFASKAISSSRILTGLGRFGSAGGALFATGFAFDLTTMIAASSYESHIRDRALDLFLERTAGENRSFGSKAGAFFTIAMRPVAPQTISYFGAQDGEIAEIKEADRKLSLDLQSDIKSYIASAFLYDYDDIENINFERFEEKVEYEGIEKEISKRFKKEYEKYSKGTIESITEDMRKNGLEEIIPQDVERTQKKFGLEGTQENLKHLTFIDLQVNYEIRNVFDDKGRLKEGKEEALIKWVFGINYSKGKLIKQRKANRLARVIDADIMEKEINMGEFDFLYTGIGNSYVYNNEYIDEKGNLIKNDLYFDALKAWTKAVSAEYVYNKEDNPEIMKKLEAWERRILYLRAQWFKTTDLAQKELIMKELGALGDKDTSWQTNLFMEIQADIFLKVNPDYKPKKASKQFVMNTINYPIIDETYTSGPSSLTFYSPAGKRRKPTIIGESDI